MGALMTRCMLAYAAACQQERADGHTRWVMSRPWYDRLRAEACTEDQEAARALAHASVWLSAMAEPPLACPACGGGPFVTMDDLVGHVAAMADPANREPDHADCLFGLRMEVRDDGGEPHLETTFPAAPQR
jgi:hypothetical protein